MPTDYAVIGLGVVGLTALLELSSRRVEVIGVDAHGVAGPTASSSGDTRIFRTIAPGTTLDAGRADLHWWQHLQARSESRFLHLDGVVTIGDPQLPAMSALLAHAQRADSAAIFSSAEAMAAWPQHVMSDSEILILDTLGGTIEATKALYAMRDIALRSGVTLRLNEEVRALRKDRAGVSLQLQAGRELRARHVILTTGESTKQLFDGGLDYRADYPLVSYFIDRSSGVSNWQAGTHLYEDGEVSFSKVGSHIKINCTAVRAGATVRARTVDPVAPEVQRATRIAHRAMRWLSDTPIRSAVSREAYSADGILVRTSSSGNVVAATGFSGSGFRRAPTIASLSLAQLQ